MNFIKKNLDLLCYGVSAFFAILVFAFMSGQAIYYKSNGVRVDGFSVYEQMEKDGKGAPIVALILLILGLLAAIALIVFILMKKDLGFEKYIALGAALLLFVAAILFFTCKGAYLNALDFPADSRKFYHLGGGAFFSGLFSILSALVIGFAGANKLAKIIK